MEFDPGPPPAFADRFERLPDLSPIRASLWFDWGPVFYRGRLDGSARVLCIASDPGATERIAGRTLVGDAGQRVQGFLGKLGLSRSYLCLNAFPYALFPSHASRAASLLSLPAFRDWRNELYDAAAEDVEAVIAFGVVARTAVKQWPGAAARRVVTVPHPSSHDEAALLAEWRRAVATLRKHVTRDPGVRRAANYESRFRSRDYAPIPTADLPFGLPAWFGDDAWARARTPPMRATVRRPIPDDRHTLIWTAPST
jgi:uracil-DNA glycosylase